ncbi:hypothetical protein DOTSEDRAFT_29360 [Dothistroma septosporum NZE10]|uniref:Uncharacterized protein n=1 Tax=Dothistroma septosporum (strain NZE10 / CBS 128990) TaxID=675120 RepID=N1PBN4_DOTSN|nr:hypothetical protein DOTSEDRAFT_29360 [Dothistroma septosporum NZE10]
MSNPKAKQLPPPQTKPPHSKPSQPKSQLTKNPAAKPPAAVKQVAKAPSGPSRPIGGGARPAPRSALSTSKSGPPVATKTPAIKPSVPPPQEREGNWVSKTIQNSVAGVGSYAGGFFNSIGASVNKVGEGVGSQYVHDVPLPSDEQGRYRHVRLYHTKIKEIKDRQHKGTQISDRTRGWGQGVAGYGNNIKDAVGVGGPRVATGGNPLGIAGMGSSQNSSGGKPVQAVRSAGKGGGSNPLGL